MEVFWTALIPLLLNLFFQQQPARALNLDLGYRYYKYHENLVVGEYFPSCVEVINVWPPPNSILTPTTVHHETTTSTTQYLFRITFSRQVTIGHLDTTSGWQPEVKHLPIRKYHPFSLNNVAPVFLSPSQTAVERYYPHRVVNWHGSSREFLFYFSLPTDEQGPNLKLSP